MEAAYMGNLKKVEYLTDFEFDLSLKNKDGYSAILLAASREHLDIVKFFAKKGVDLNKTLKYAISMKDNSKSWYSLSSSHNSWECVFCNALKTLVRSGANIDIEVNDLGETLLSQLAKENKDYINSELLNTILRLNPNINKIDKLGNNPLSLAIKNKNTEFLEIFLEQDVDYFSTNKNGVSCIELAFGSSWPLYSKEERIKLLSSILHQDASQREVSSLIALGLFKRIAVTEKLQYGNDKHLGLSYYIKHRKNNELALALISGYYWRWHFYYPLYEAVEYDNLEALQQFLVFGERRGLVYVNSVNHHRTSISAFLFAAENEQIRHLQTMYPYVHNMRETRRDDYLFDLFIIGIEKSNIDIIKIALQNEFKYNQKDIRSEVKWFDKDLQPKVLQILRKRKWWNEVH